MSVQAMAWALTQQAVKEPTSRHVLVALANYAGADGCGAHPPAETLAEETGLTERTVRTKLDQLELQGLIKRDLTMIGWLSARHGAGTRPICYDLVLDYVEPPAVPMLALTAPVAGEAA